MRCQTWWRSRFDKTRLIVCHCFCETVHQKEISSTMSTGPGRGCNWKHYLNVGQRSKKLHKGTGKIIGFYLTNQNTIYLLHLFYSDNKIITVRGIPAICTIIGWVKSSCLFSSFSGFCGQIYMDMRFLGWFLIDPTFNPLKFLSKKVEICKL